MKYEFATLKFQNVNGSQTDVPKHVSNLVLPNAIYLIPHSQ